LVTIPEGILAYQTLAKKGLWTPSLRKRLEDHAERTWDLSPIVWHLSNIVCPLLEKDRCSIYEARPFACRVTFSKGDPFYCHPHQLNANAPMVPKREALEGFYAKQGRELRRHKLDVITLSLSKAILIGEKISNGEEEIENLLRMLIQEMSK
jgi:Fe-S-cluster containining protein